MHNSLFIDKQNFIIKLGLALHKFGTPAYRLEAHLTSVVDFLGITGQFLITPTAITFVLSEDDEQQDSTYIARVKPGELDLGALSRTNELVDSVASGECSMKEALERLKAITNQPAPHSHFITLLAFAFTGGSFAMLLRTGWWDVFFAFALSMIIYIPVYLSERSQRIAAMIEPLVALIAAFLATGLSIINPAINVPCITLSAIVVFIPGLSLTLGLSELAARDLSSGTSRIMDSFMILFKLYFGVYLGSVLGNILWDVPTYISPPVVEPWLLWVAIPVLSFSLTVIFKTRKKDIYWGVLAGLIAYGFSQLGTNFLGEGLGPFLGAFAVGIYSNIYARYMKAPASIALLQGVVVLVPGSKAYISLNTMVSGQEIITNQTMGAQVFLIFMSITAGLIFANVTHPPNRTL